MINVQWSKIEKNVIIWKFNPPWTFEDFDAARAESYAMIDSAEGNVDIIFLTSEAQYIPPGTIAYLRKNVIHHHPRHGYIVVVGAKTHLMTLLNCLTELVPGFANYLRFARTQTEAYVVIAKQTANHTTKIL